MFKTLIIVCVPVKELGTVENIVKNDIPGGYPGKGVIPREGDNSIYHPQVYKHSHAPGGPDEASTEGGVSQGGAGRSPASLGFWTPNGYVKTFEEWKNNSQKFNNSDSLYSAYVPSIEQIAYGTILRECGLIFGSNKMPSDDTCGQIYRKIVCSGNDLHKQPFRHMRCNDPGCPICYVKHASRMSDRVAERVQGFKTVYRNEKVYHLIFWPQQRSGRPYADCAAAFKDSKDLMNKMGVTAAVVWYHPYRIRDEIKRALRLYRRHKGLDGRAGFWKMAHDDVLEIGGIENYIVSGPHWHAIATGFLRHVRKFSEENGGAGYKKKRYLDKEREVHEVAHYISTHACREVGKSSVRYYGDLSYRMLAREMVDKKIKDVKCEVCGSRLMEFECDETGVPSNKIKDNITECVKYYLYWKKGQSKPDMKDGSQCLITRFSRETVGM